MNKAFQSLAEKVQLEYEEYINSLRKATIDKIIEANYEIYWKKAIVNYISYLAECDYGDDNVPNILEFENDAVLLSTVKHPLALIYEEWMKESWLDDSEKDLLNVIEGAAMMAKTHFFK